MESSNGEGSGLPGRGGEGLKEEGDGEQRE